METFSADSRILLGQWYEGLRSRAKLMLLVSLLLFGISSAYILKLPNIYRAETRILVNPQRVSDKYVSSAVSMGASERLNTLSQQVLSTSRLEAIFDELHLFSPQRDTVGRQQLIAQMRQNIGIELKQSADGLSSFTLSYEGESPAEVAAVTNRLADSFISWNLHDREQEAQGTTDFLNGAVIESKEKLDSLEERLRIYKQEHLGELPDQEAANLQTLSRLEVQLQANVEARNHIDQEVLLTSLDPRAESLHLPSSAQPVQPARVRLEIARTELTELKKRYTVQHPDVQAQGRLVAELEHEVNAGRSESGSEGHSSPQAEKISSDPRIQVMVQERDHLLASQRATEANIRRIQSRVDAEPVREQEISQLLRDYETAKQHYAVLLEKNYSAQMAAELERKQQGGSFTLLDVARIPDQPVRPKKGALVLGAFLFALFAGIGVGVLLEMNDSTIKSDDELRHILPHIPVLGLTPSILQRAPEKSRPAKSSAITRSSHVPL